MLTALKFCKRRCRTEHWVFRTFCVSDKCLTIDDYVFIINSIKTIVEDALDLGAAYVLSDFNIDGQVCTCNSDLCTTDTTPCNGGFFISTVW